MNWTYTLVSLLATASFAAAQSIPLDQLTRLAPKAKEKVEVNLEGAMLDLASRFLDDKKPDEANARQIMTGIKGIYVRSYEFSKPGEYTADDVNRIRSIVAAPAWQRLVNVESEKETAGVYLKMNGKLIDGLVVIAAEPTQLTVVNIVGSIDPARIRELGGKFGIPQMDFSNDRAREGKKKD